MRHARHKTIHSFPGRRLAAALMCLWAMPGACLAAGPAPAPADAPVWVEAEGEATLGDVETPKEVMEAAKRKAVAKAIEQARGIFVKSHVLVSNGQLAEDLIYASVQGRAASIIPVRQGWDGSDRWVYKVHLKVLVEPVRPYRAGFALNVAMAKADLREGESAHIVYQPTRNCYVYIFSVAADGSVTLLLPNFAHPDNRVLAQRGTRVPACGQPRKAGCTKAPRHEGGHGRGKDQGDSNPEKGRPASPWVFRKGSTKYSTHPKPA